MLAMELGIVTILIIVNGLLSMSELAIVSSRPARLAGLVEKGVKGSRRALALASDPGKFLSTVQIGITLIGVLSGAISGATLGLRLTAWLVDLGLSQGLADAIGVGAVVTIITYASLIVGELVPKQIALRDPEAIAVRVAPAMVLLSKISLPLVWLLDRSGKALLWLLGQQGEAQEKVSEEEIRTLVVEAENAGLLDIYLSGQTPDARKLVRDAPIIPESLDARDVVSILRDSPVHIGLVHDEYGTFQGVVTSADILEAIVGSFHTEEGPAEPAAVKREDGSYLISGWMPAIEFAELLKIPLPTSRRYQTIAGFLLQEFGTIPNVDEHVEAHGWRFEIVDLDGRRIDKVLVTPAADLAA